MGLQRRDEGFLVGLAERVEGEGVDAVHAPVPVQAEFHLEQRCAEELEDLARDVLHLLHRGLTEEDGELETGRLQAIAAAAQHLVDLAVEVRCLQAVDRLARQVLDGAHRRHHFVPPCFGQQGTVVAHREIAVVAAQVDDAQGAFLHQRWLFEVIACTHHAQGREGGAPVGLVLDQDQVFGHRWFSCSGSTGTRGISPAVGVARARSRVAFTPERP